MKDFDHQGKEMSFLDHLEELRWHLLRSLAAIVIFSVIAFFNKEIVFGQLILGPSKPDFWTYRILCEMGNRFDYKELCVEKLNFIIQNRTVMGQFTTHLTISFVAGLIVAFPYVFWEIWRFIKPGLYSMEISATRGAVSFVSFLFLIGIAFGYFILVPISLNFLASYTIDASIANQFDLSSYISVITTLVLGCGLMFQLPMVVLILARIGIATPRMMKNYRRHTFVVILFIAAIITPTSDPFTLMLVAFPLYGLFELGILLAAIAEKSRIKKASESSLD
jgi:sec-independent protein translocase protein TatC